MENASAQSEAANTSSGTLRRRWYNDNLLLVMLVISPALFCVNIFPGAIGRLVWWVGCGSVVLIPLAILAIIIERLMFRKRDDEPAVSTPARSALRKAILIGVPLVTIVMVSFDIPLRIAFSFCRADFEALLDKAPVCEAEGEPLNRAIGIYTVDEYAADKRGGVYFRVHWTADGIGPDRISYGFAFKPNHQGSPFGKIYYTTTWLFGDWYWFYASNEDY